MKKPALILAVLLVLGTNIVALLTISRNRPVTPVQTIELTERELTLVSMGQGNSGAGLQLEWIRPSQRYKPGYLDQPKLERIGFDFRMPPARSGKERSLLPREALAVLEYGGKAYEQWLQEALADKARDAALNPRPYESTDPAASSHLIPIDVGTDFYELRGRYSDQSRYLIVQAVIRANVVDVWNPDKTTITSHYGSGFVQEILPSYISVPLPYTRLLAPLKPQKGKEPRYSATLEFSRRLEPRIAFVTIH